MKKLIFIGFLSALLFPIIWSRFIDLEIAKGFLRNYPVQVFGVCSMTGINAVGAFWVMNKLFKHKSGAFFGLLTRLGAAFITGTTMTLASYLIMTFSGHKSSFLWMADVAGMPSFYSAFVSYWIVKLFVATSSSRDSIRTPR